MGLLSQEFNYGVNYDPRVNNSRQTDLNVPPLQPLGDVIAIDIDSNIYNHNNDVESNLNQENNNDSNIEL